MQNHQKNFETVKNLVWKIGLSQNVYWKQAMDQWILYKPRDFCRSALTSAGCGDISTFSCSVPPVEDFIKNPIPTKVNCLLKEFISPDFISFAFIQGDSRVVFQQALLITCWCFIHSFRSSSYTASQFYRPRILIRHWFFLQLTLKALPCGIFRNLWTANGCHVLRILQPKR